MVKLFTFGLTFLLSLQLLWAQQPAPAYQKDLVVFKLKDELKGEDPSTKGARTLGAKAPATLAAEIAHKVGAGKAISILSQSLPLKAQANARSSKAHPLAGLYQLELQGGQGVAEVILQLQSNKLVEYAEPYYLPELLNTPDDEFIPEQRHLELLKAFKGWDITQGNRDIIIGILDTGVDFTHSDLTDNLYLNEADPIDGIDNDGDGFIDNYYGWDFANSDNNPTADQSQHGTQVTGFSSASTNNDIGIAGTGYKCRYMPIKIFRSENGTFRNGYEAILYAAEMGCDVINLSWGAAGIRSQYVQDIINYVVLEKDVVVVAAAGNTAQELNFFPASYDNVLSVTSSDYTDTKAGYATWSRYVDLMAPGKDVFTTLNGGGYGTATGTSFASPQVAGAAALVRSFYPELNARQVMMRLRMSADDVSEVGNNQDFAEKIGKGRLNMENALAKAVSPAMEMQHFEIFNGSGPFAFYNDTLEISMQFINFLSSTTDLKVKLSTNSPYVSLLNNEISLGTVNTMSTVSNEDQPFRVHLHPDLPGNEVITFRLGYDDLNYSDYQYFELRTSGDYIDFKTNSLSLTVSSNGNLGYNSDYNLQGLGFRHKNNSLAHNMGFVVAQNPNAVANNVVQDISLAIRNKDFKAQTRLKLFNNSSALRDARSTYETKVAAAPLNLMIEQKILGWEDDTTSLVMEYRITNKADTTYEQLQAGMFVDFDIQEFYKNKAAWDGEHLLGYAYDHQESRYAGISLLSEYKVNYHALDIADRHGNQNEVEDSLRRAQKYQYLANGIGKEGAGLEGDGNDIAQLLGGTIPELQPMASSKIAFALLTAPSLKALKEAVLAARIRYQEYQTNPPLLASLPACPGNNLEVFPPDGEQFAFFSDPTGQNLLKTGSSFLFENLTRDTILYVANADEPWLSDIGQIQIEVEDPFALFEMSTDTLAINPGETGMLTLTDLSENAAEWFWEFNNGYQSLKQSPKAYYNETDTYYIQLTMQNTAGCEASYQQKLVVIHKNDAPVMADILLCQAGSALLKQENGEPFTLYADQQKEEKLFEGSEYETEVLSQPTTFYASSGSGFYESDLSPVQLKVYETGLRVTHSIDTTAEPTYALLLKASPQLPEEVARIEWYIDGVLQGQGTTLSWPYQADESSISLQAIAFYYSGCQANQHLEIPLQESPVPEITALQACKGAEVYLRPQAEGIYYFYEDPDKAELRYKGRELKLNDLQESVSFYISNISEGHESALVQASVALPDGLAEFSASSDTIYQREDGSVLLESLHPQAINWHWDFGDGLSSLIASPEHYYEYPGEYTVSLTAESSNGCRETYVRTLRVLKPTGLFSQQPALMRLKLSPNPAKNYLRIEFPTLGQNAILQVKDASGRLIGTHKVSAAQNQLELGTHGYAAGWYMLSLQNDQHLYTGRFIKE